MNELEELIQALCPKGVEYKSFDEISMRLRGMSGVSKKWYGSGNCRFIEYKNAYDNLKIDVHQLPFATVKKLDTQIVLKQGDILFTSASETPNECAISSVIEDSIENGIFLDDHLFGIRLREKNINPIYLNYYCHTNEFRKKVYRTVRGVTRFYVSLPDFMKIDIPIPPLPVQEEIVRILDNFTELTAELTTELTARKKQYEYYRDALLTFNKNVEYIKISDTDLVNIKRGIRVVKGQLSDKNHIPVFQNSLTPLGFYDRYNVNSDTTFVIVAGAAGEIGFSDVNFWAADDCFYFETSKGYLNKFLYYVLMKNKLVLQSKVRKASIPRLSRIAIEQVQIPIISLKEQQRIVDILDRFDKLCNDITEGLPAEIEARQKQYEYYRDKLLTFKSLEEVK